MDDYVLLIRAEKLISKLHPSEVLRSFDRKRPPQMMSLFEEVAQKLPTTFNYYPTNPNTISFPYSDIHWEFVHQTHLPILETDFGLGHGFLNWLNRGCQTLLVFPNLWRLPERFTVRRLGTFRSNSPGLYTRTIQAWRGCSFNMNLTDYDLLP